MPFRHSCFISYSHGQRLLAERIINDLYDALSGELEVEFRKEIFVDRERLRGGEYYNETLATALCESVCMIMVFTPTYFDKEHTFCAREFKAMEKLEVERLKHLRELTHEKYGLIIPIIFRGEKVLPKEIKERWHYYNFDKFQLCENEMSRHPEYAPTIRKIAEYIFEIHEILNALQDDPCESCAKFTLPSEQEIKPWLDRILLERVRSFVPRLPLR